MKCTPYKMNSARDNLSKFVVHLSKDYEKSKADDNVISILKSKTIEARNYHCLFNDLIRNSKLSKQEKEKFKTVCFTETPLDKIFAITDDKIARKIKLKHFGIGFLREDILKSGGSPAIYINGIGTDLNRTLRQQFSQTLSKVEELAKYYSLVNVINKRYDFSWEREWRHVGNYMFEYSDIAAIIAEEPELFKQKIQESVEEEVWNELKKLLIISPNWNYEDIIHGFSKQLRAAHD